MGKAESAYTEQKSKGDKAKEGDLEGDTKKMEELANKVTAKEKVFKAKKEAWEAKAKELKDAQPGAKKAIEEAMAKAKKEMDAEEVGLKDF